MNTKIIVGLIGVMILGGVWYALGMQADTDMMMKATEESKDKMMEEDMSVETDMMDEKDMDMEEATMMKEDMMEKTDMMSAGSYELYSEEKVAMAETGKVVLFFRASWCPSCRIVDADIKANLGAIPSDVTILEVNYDEATDLKQKYGVTYQHTFVQVDAAGNQLAKWSGGNTLASVLANIK